MARWSLHLNLDEQSDKPIFLRIVEAIVEAVEQERVKPGDRLPGHRTLAESLHVNRNTVLAAYQELIAEGWVTAQLGSGTHISNPLPNQTLKPRSASIPVPPAAPVGFDLGEAQDHPPSGSSLPAKWVMNTGLPDPRLFPTTALVRAYRRAMLSRRGEALVARDPQGDVRLRKSLAGMLATTRGIPTDPEAVLITRGSQMAAFLVAATILGPGDTVAVEALGSPNVFRAIVHTGAEMVALPVDREGLDTERLEALLQQTRIRAVFLTPHRQYPTTAPMGQGRRQHLMALAAQHRFAVVEMEHDPELQFEGSPRLSLAAQDPAGVVIHVGTLSKVLSPGFRLGYMKAPIPVIQRMLPKREHIDGQGDTVLEVAMAELIEDGELQRHINRVRRIYHQRRDALAAALRHELGDRFAFDLPDGGVALWGRVPEGIDASAWAMGCLERGVLIYPGSRYAAVGDGDGCPGVRIGFSRYSEPELAQVAREMAQALAAKTPPPKGLAG